MPNKKRRRSQPAAAAAAPVSVPAALHPIPAFDCTIIDSFLRQSAPDIAQVCELLGRNSHYVQQDIQFFNALPNESKDAYRRYIRALPGCEGASDEVVGLIVTCLNNQIDVSLSYLLRVHMIAPINTACIRPPPPTKQRTSPQA